MGELDGKAEYDSWLTPAEVLGRLGRRAPWESLARTVASSLSDGLMRAIAETIVIPPNGPQSYFELAPWAWRRWPCLTDQDFWALGTLERSSDSPGMREAGLPHFRAYRVRLERAKIEQILGGASGTASRSAPPPAPAPAKRDLPPKIDPQTLKAWVADFGARNPGASFVVFRDNARLAFPRLRVGERPVRAAIADSGMALMPGNPSILRK
jgi:hypothetical protein